jgi:hypothetical protein
MLIYLNNYCDISESSSKLIFYHLDRSTLPWHDYLDKANSWVNVVAIVYESELTNFLLERAYYIGFSLPINNK